MVNKIELGLTNLVSLKYFSLFPEYFISVSILYILIVLVLITCNVYGLMLQKAVSDCMGFILLMTCYLVFNDDLMVFGFYTFQNSIITDYFSYFTKIIVCLSSAIYFLIIANSLKEQRLTSFEYLLLILFSVLGLILLCSTYNLLTAYLAIELTSLSCYLLASFKKTSVYSLESGIKYFITGAVSSSFFLLGTSFLYGFIGSINFDHFFVLIEFRRFFLDPLDFIYMDLETNLLLAFQLFLCGSRSQELALAEQINTGFVELGLFFILISLFIKLGVAPFHLWSLDVYEGSPTTSTFFFAVISKLSVFVLLIRMCHINLFSYQDSWNFYFLIVGILSVFVGSFGGLLQRKLKTLLAYSSITHMGYSFIAFSTGTDISIESLFFYLIVYIITGLTVWSIVLFLRVKKKGLGNKYSKELGDLSLLHKSNSSLALSFALTMFSMAGIPPLIGFLAKIGVFLSFVQYGYYLIAFFSILFSVVSTFYYIRIIKVMYFENLLVGQLYYPIENNKTLILSLLVFSLIFLFVNPTLLYLLVYNVGFSFTFFSFSEIITSDEIVQ